MDAFKRLIWGALAAGALAGFVLFLVQWGVMIPLIQEAERYEHAAHAVHAEQEAQAGGGATAAHETAWQPSDGFERTAYTALGTTLTGVGYAAMFLGIASLMGWSLDGRRAWLLGLAGFACFALGPALGLPPKPPGAAVPDLRAAQAWWLATSIATGTGLWLIGVSRGSWTRRGIGLLCLLAPHLVGAPSADHVDTLPRTLVWQFTLTSVASQAVFWLVLAKAASFVLARQQRLAFDGDGRKRVDQDDRPRRLARES